MKRKLPKLEEEYIGETKEIFSDYKEYRETLSKPIFYVLLSLFLIEFLVWLILLCIKNKEEEKKDNNCKKLTILFYAVFGLVSTIVFVFSPYLYYNCKNRYSKNFHLDGYYKEIFIPYNYYEGYWIDVEQYDYGSYPSLEEINNIYYLKNKRHKVNEVIVNYDNIGIPFFYLAIVAMPALSIIAFILLIIFKCKNQCHGGFVVMEILSILLKLCISFWPYVWITQRFKKNIINSKEEIKYIVDDYLNYAKCTNKFPIILIVECAFIFLEIIMFLISFKGSCKNDSTDTTVHIPIPTHNSENNNIPQVITRVIERTVKIEPEKVVLKFKDNKHNNYEIETYIKRRFYDVFNELIGRYDLKKNEILSVIHENRYLYLNNRNCFMTIEDLHLNNNSDYIIINFKEQPINTNSSITFQRNEQVTINIIKKKLPPLPKMQFCIINLDDRKFEVDRKENLLFETILENLKKNNEELSNLIFDPIFYTNRGEKIYIDDEKLKKTIKELNIPKDVVISIKATDKDNIPINIEFIWVNENNKKYEFKSGSKEKFHSVAMEFIGTFDEFINNIITRFYKIKNNQDEPVLYTRENDNILTTGNQNFEIIETEFFSNFQTLDNLDISNDSEIFFETRLNTMNNSNQFLRNSYLMISQFKEQGNRIITFKTSINNDIYFIIVNENEKFEEAIIKLRIAYPIIFKDAEIKSALLHAENLLSVEKKQLQIKNLNIHDNDFILIPIQINKI